MWERVNIEHPRFIVERFPVPAGWMYVLRRKTSSGIDDRYISTVFVEDSQAPDPPRGRPVKD